MKRDVERTGETKVAGTKAGREGGAREVGKKAAGARGAATADLKDVKKKAAGAKGARVSAKKAAGAKAAGAKAARVPQVSFAVFETAIGWCGMAWSTRGVTRFLLPEATEVATEERMRALCPGAEVKAPDAWVAELIARVRGHLAGTPDDFADVPLDTASLPPFFAAVYEALRRVTAGATTTYGALGRKIGGSTGAARAVGTAMAKNPYALLVPCHRVVGTDGKLHGFSAHGGLITKARLLAIEGRAEPEQTSMFGDGVAAPAAGTRSYVKESAKVAASARGRRAARGA